MIDVADSTELGILTRNFTNVRGRALHWEAIRLRHDAESQYVQASTGGWWFPRERRFLNTLVRSDMQRFLQPEL